MTSSTWYSSLSKYGRTTPSSSHSNLHLSHIGVVGIPRTNCDFYLFAFINTVSFIKDILPCHLYQLVKIPFSLQMRQSCTLARYDPFCFFFPFSSYSIVFVFFRWYLPYSALFFSYLRMCLFAVEGVARCDRIEVRLYLF